jgi:tyrosine-protein kinase Etk/Wzc
MTQGTPHAHNGNPAQVRPGEAKRLSLIDIVENVFYYRWIFIATFLGVLLLSVLFALSQSPVYTADALIEVAQNHSPLGPLAGPQGAGAGGDAGSVAGEMETVRTRKVLGYAVDKLKQNIQVQWAVTDRIPYIGRLLAHTLPTDGEGLVICLGRGAAQFR